MGCRVVEVSSPSTHIRDKVARMVEMKVVFVTSVRLRLKHDRFTERVSNSLWNYTLSSMACGKKDNAPHP